MCVAVIRLLLSLDHGQSEYNFWTVYHCCFAGATEGSFTISSTNVAVSQQLEYVEIVFGETCSKGHLDILALHLVQMDVLSCSRKCYWY